MVRLRQAVWTNPGNLCMLPQCTCQVSLLALLGFPDWDQAISRLGTAASRSLSLRIAPVCPRPTAQQDCDELLAHLAERLGSALLFGSWDARVLEEGSVRVVIPVIVTLGLDPPAAARADVQALVGQWHGQHTMHALRCPPQVLVLRIARYNQLLSRTTVSLRGHAS